MVEMVEILDGRLGKRSVERVRYVINNLLHLVIVKYGDISLVVYISTHLRLVTILSPGFHTGFLAWGGEIYWCINEARKCERRGLGYLPPWPPPPPPPIPRIFLRIWPP